MKLLAACALALLAALSAHAQDAAADAERARLRAERAALDARFAEAKRACNARFAVTDCVEEAAREHSTARAEVRRQERVLNEAERRRRAAERLRAQEERNAPEAQKAAAERRARAVAEQLEREVRAREKAERRQAEQAARTGQPGATKAPAAAPAPQGKARAPQKGNSPPLTAEEAASNRAAYEARVREAQRHKEEVQQRLATRSKPAASGLPPPKLP